MVKAKYWIKKEKNNNKDGKALYKLMNNIICGKQWKALEKE